MLARLALEKPHLDAFALPFHAGAQIVDSRLKVAQRLLECMLANWNAQLPSCLSYSVSSP